MIKNNNKVKNISLYNRNIKNIFNLKNNFTESIDLTDNSYIKVNENEYFLNKDSNRKIFILIEFINIDFILNVHECSTVIDLKKFLLSEKINYFKEIFDINIYNVNKMVKLNNNDILCQNKNLIVYKKEKNQNKIIDNIFNYGVKHRKNITLIKNRKEFINNFNLNLVISKKIIDVNVKNIKKKFIFHKLDKKKFLKIKLKNVDSVKIGEFITLLYKKNKNLKIIKSKESLQFIKYITNIN